MDRSVTSTERAVGSLRNAILRGEIPAGARLAEVDLAARLGVSRTPVREALPRLAAEGLVELVPNRGARVTRWSQAELEGVFELRAAIEPRLTALAVPRATARDVAELAELAERMQRIGAPGPEADLAALVPLNSAFHDRLVTLAGHPALAGALAPAIRPPIVRRNFSAYDDASLSRSLAHHAEIVAAFRAHDPEWAAAVMTAHLANARAVMLRTASASAAQPAPHRHDRRTKENR